MNCKKLIIGILGVVAAGYTSGSGISVVDDASLNIYIEHPEIKLKTIFLRRNKA